MSPLFCELLQALFDDVIIPFSESSITKSSLGILEIVIFIIFGNLFPNHHL